MNKKEYYELERSKEYPIRDILVDEDGEETIAITVVFKDDIPHMTFVDLSGEEILSFSVDFVEDVGVQPNLDYEGAFGQSEFFNVLHWKEIAGSDTICRV
jgi:hypothetical protein